MMELVALGCCDNPFSSSLLWHARVRAADLRGAIASSRRRRGRHPAQSAGTSRATLDPAARQKARAGRRTRNPAAPPHARSRVARASASAGLRRGAPPIQWAIMRGESVTGIRTFQMDEGMDNGATLSSASTAIGPEETAGDLAVRLATLGADVLIETLAQLDALTPTPQRHEDATLAPRLKRTDGHLDWNRPARELVNIVRGCNPWPGALTRGPAGPLTIWRATALVSAHTHAPGTLERPTAQADYPAIAASDGWLCPVEVQPENRRAMSWSDYLRGARLPPRALFAGLDPSRPAS